MKNTIKVYKGYSTSIKPYKEVNFGDKYYEYDTQKWFTWSLNHIWVEDNIQAVYTIDLINNHFILYENGIEVGNENLSPYVNDEETFVASGTLNASTFIATFTRNTGTAFNVDLSALFTSVWQLNGNTNGVLKNFGTKDNFDLPIIINNTEVGRFKVGGNFGVGTTNPTEKLDVVGKVKSSEGFLTNRMKLIGNDANHSIIYGDATNNRTTIQNVGGSYRIDVNKDSVGGRTFRVQNNGVDLFTIQANVGNAGNSPRFHYFNNAQGDVTYTKQVVSKSDGTLGIEDKYSLNAWGNWIDIPAYNINTSKVDSANTYLKYRLKNNIVQLTGKFTPINGQSFSSGELVYALPQSIRQLTSYNNGINANRIILAQNNGSVTPPYKSLEMTQADFGDGNGYRGRILPLDTIDNQILFFHEYNI